MAPKTKKPAAKTTSKTAGAKPANKPKTKASTSTAAAAKTTAKPVEKPVAATPEVIEPPALEPISLKQVAGVLFQDTDDKVAKSGKWPLVIDGTGQVATFLRHRDVNYINVLNQRDMEAEQIRLSLIGAIRFGKPFVLDLMDIDMFETCSLKFDPIQKGLLDAIVDKSIMAEENYMKLVKDSDGPDYHVNQFNDMYTENFKFFILTTHPAPPPSLMAKTYPIKVE